MNGVEVGKKAAEFTTEDTETGAQRTQRKNGTEIGMKRRVKERGVSMFLNVINLVLKAQSPFQGFRFCF